jgi:hypothetical protein
MAPATALAEALAVGAGGAAVSNAAPAGAAFSAAAPDWGALPAEVLSVIASEAMLGGDVSEFVRCWEKLALVNKHWYRAVRAVPLRLELTRGAHASPASRRWLARASLTHLVLDRAVFRAPPAAEGDGASERGGGGGASERGSASEPSDDGSDGSGWESDDGSGSGSGSEDEDVASSDSGASAAAPRHRAAAARVDAFFNELLGDAGFRARNAARLAALVNASPAALPHLIAGNPDVPAFTALKEVKLFVARRAGGGAPGLPAALGALPRLECLAISGFFAQPALEALPRGLRHLSFSLHAPGAMAAFVPSPAAATRLELEYLSLRADAVALGLGAVVALCREARVAAKRLYLGVGAAADAALARAEGGAEGAAAAPASASPAMRAAAYGERLGGLFAAAPPGSLQRLVLCFGEDLALFAAPAPVAPGEPSQLRIDAVGIDADALLEAVNGPALERWDVRPSLEKVADFVRDRPSRGDAFVLALARQDAPGPRSYTFTTAAGPAEAAALAARPAWRIACCPGPGAAALLAEPAVVAANAPTLRALTRVDLSPELDLAPFHALRALGGRAGAAGAAALRGRLPPSLTSLALEAPPGDEGAGDGALELDAAFFAALPSLRELTLAGYASADLCALPPHVTSLRVANPDLAWGGPASRGALRLPSATAAAGGGGAAGAVAGAAGAIFAGAAGALGRLFWRGNRRAAAAPEPAAPAPAAAAPPAAASADYPLRSRAPPPASRHYDDGLDAAGDGSGSDSEAEADDAAAAAARGEAPPACCNDPLCPVHSGKRHLQVTFSDGRPAATVALGAAAGGILLSGFQVITLTHSLQNAPAVDEDAIEVDDPSELRLDLGGASLAAFAAELAASPVEVLEVNPHAAAGLVLTGGVGGGAVLAGGAGRGADRVPLVEALRAVLRATPGVWAAETWDGARAAAGLQRAGACGYALVRRSVRAPREEEDVEEEDD